MSKDHEAIVFHDYDLKRLANKDLQIKDLTSQELRDILLLDTESSIPTLDEVLYAVNGKTPLMIEIKSGNHPFIEERLTEILKSYDGPVCVKSFDLNTIKWFKINAPFIKYGLIGSNLDININELKDLNIDFLSYDIKFINDAIVTEAKNKKIPIKTMPEVYRYSEDKLSQIVDRALKLKIPMVAIFPQTNNILKDSYGSEALNENNLVCKAIRKIKDKYKNEIGIMTDVALDPYTSHGHDGILRDKKILNDETIEILIQQSLLQAQMGSDVIAPSDMMDGRIGEIRQELDNNSLKDIKILSYAVKYASSFYGPFRDAVGSKKSLKGDKKTYQMDFSNSEEALREVALDIKEGADIVMVKPGLPYLDIIKKVKENFKIPVLAYQVSGEYSLLMNGINKGLINKNSIYETLMSFKRAGSNAIISYFADRIDKIITA